jgi:hypothetical protein
VFMSNDGALLLGVAICNIWIPSGVSGLPWYTPALQACSARPAHATCQVLPKPGIAPAGKHQVPDAGMHHHHHHALCCTWQ